MSTHCQLHLHRTVVTLLALATLGTGTSARAQLGLGLLPMRVELRLAPGQESSGSLKLSSQSGAKTRVRSEVLDFYIDDKATPQFERDLPQESAISCKKWLSLNPMEIELDNGGYLNVRYTVRVPTDASEGSYNCAAGFTTLPSAELAAAPVGMRMAVRIVAAIYVQVGSPHVLGKLKEIKLEPLAAVSPVPLGSGADATAPPSSTSAGGWQAVVVMENRGKMYYRPTGKLEVLDESGKLVEGAGMPSLPVLRERDQRFIFPLKTKLEAGHYKLRAQVDIGTGEIQQGSADVTVE